MQMRFDGYLGFPGGLIDEGENVLDGLNRELVEEMHLDVNKYPVKEEDYVITHWSPSKKLMLHFYALEVAINDHRYHLWVSTMGREQRSQHSV